MKPIFEIFTALQDPVVVCQNLKQEVIDAHHRHTENVSKDDGSKYPNVNIIIPPSNMKHILFRQLGLISPILSIKKSF